jgi:flagellar hook-length control protein FliK
MLTTVHGRVEMDPTGIPRPASMSAGRDDAFAQVLQQATEPEPRVDPRNVEREHTGDDGPADNAVEPRTRERDDVAGASEQACEATSAAQPATQPAAHDEIVETADATDSIRRGEPVRQETAGKGADSPRTSTAQTAQVEPLLAAVVQHAANVQGPVAVAGGERAVDAIGGARAVDAPTRGTETQLTKAAAALRTPATTGAYRTNGAASAELLEQARDSVFKQILVKLTGDGGEMRVRLEPPDLGQLDLKLVVDQGNRLQLTIAADRQDTAQMLQKHLDELVHTLQQAGLEVAGASVQTRSEFAREQQNRREQPAPDAFFADADEVQPTTDPKRGYVRASGLDFWA